MGCDTWYASLFAYAGAVLLMLAFIGALGVLRYYVEERGRNGGRNG